MAHLNYLTLDEYEDYGGNIEEEEEFNPLELVSRKRIDRLTDCRVQNMETIPESVKMCMYALINMEKNVGTEAQANNPVVTSFNTDGYSESYGNALNNENAQKAMNRIVSEYLFGERDDNGVPLLYRGVR